MSFLDWLLRAFDNLLGRKTRETQGLPQDAPTPAPAPFVPVPPEYVEAYDGFGRALRVPREEWRSKVLLPEIARNWDNPENLYSHVASALRDGFEADVVDAARHLATEYPGRDEYANILGCILLQLGETDEAEAAFHQYLSGNAPFGYLLANLARVYDAQGRQPLVDETLWRAMEIDPNQKQGLNALLERAAHRGGDHAQKAVLDRASSIPGSWRPQLIVAYQALTEGRVADAVARYAEMIREYPHSGELLMIVSGQLGNLQHTDELIRLVAPVYSPERHGPLAGINLLQAYLIEKDLMRGDPLLHALLDLGVPIYREKLLEYARQFDEIRKSTRVLVPGEGALEMNVVVLTEPIWCSALSDALWLLPEKSQEVMSIAFVSLANLTPVPERDGVEVEDDAGRLSRAIPLYMMEAFHLHREAAPYFIQPVIDNIGPAVSGLAWSQEMLTGLLRTIQRPTEMVVSGSVINRASDYEITLTVWAAQGMAELESMTRTTTLAGLGDTIAAFEKDLAEFLELIAPLSIEEFAVGDERLEGDALTSYILSEGQSMALLLARHGICPLASLWGERQLIGAPLDLLLSYDGIVQTPALLFLANLWFDKQAGSNIYSEFRLQAISLLDQSAPNSPLRRLSPLVYKLFDMDGEYERSKEILRRGATGSYAAWLAGV